MDYRNIFGTNRPRRQRRRSRLNRSSGEPVDLLQLMRRRVRYRPYTLNRLRSHSREMNLTNYDSNLSQNFNFLPESLSVNRDVLGLYGNVECKDVSTNTEYPCCSGVSSVARRSERTVGTNPSSSASKPTNLESRKSSVEHEGNRRSQQSSAGVVKNINSPAHTQNDNKKPTMVDSNNNREERPAVSTKDLPTKSNSNVTASEVKLVTNHQQSSSCTVTDSTDISSDTIDESSHNSSLVVEPNTSGESLNMPTPPTIAYIEVHHSSSQEHITTSDSSLNNVIRSLPLIGPIDGDVDLEADAEAGGDGHHNDSVLQFEITLTTAVPDIEDMIENDEEDEHNDDDDDNEIEDNDDNEIEHNDDDDDDNENDNEIDDNDNEVEEVEEEEQGVGD